MFDPSSLWQFHHFWNFDQPPVNCGLKTSKIKELFLLHRLTTHTIEQL